MRRACAARTQERVERRGATRSFLAGVANYLRRVAVRRLAEPDQTFAPNLHRIAAHEGFLAILAEHKGAVRTLIDQHEFIAADFDPGVQPRDEVALHHQIVLLGAAHRDVRTALGDQDLLPLVSKPQPLRLAALLALARGNLDRAHHAG